MNRKRSFEIQARDRAGNVLNIHIDAESTEALYRELSKRHLFALEVKENLLRRFFILPKQSGVKKREIRDLFFQMGTYLDAGISLEKLLKLLHKQQKNIHLKASIDEIHKGVRSGQRFSELILQHPSVFPGYIAASLKAGEESGNIAGSLLEISRLLDLEIKLMDSLISSFTYPLILLITAVVSIFLIIYFAVPRFAKMFADMGKPMPFILNIMHAASIHFWMTACTAFLLTAATAGGLIFAWKSNKLRSRLDNFLINVPKIGPILVNYQLSLYFRLLGMAIRSSLPADKGIELANSTLISKSIKKVFDTALIDIRKGGRFSSVLQKISWMPDSVTSLIDVAEESGDMGKMSLKISNIIGEDLNTGLTKLIALAEPVMIVFVSLIIGGVIISLLYSLFSINF
ncbi:type II secretion system F family protein [Desulfosarcina sp. BuS5]|nr:type II secretion system F family protein [Desulfosarcina sp. BuS5]